MNEDAPQNEREAQREPSKRKTRRSSTSVTRRPRLRDQVYDFIFFLGARGATDDEGYTALGMVVQTYSPRRGELVKLGLVKPSTCRRRTASGRHAIVWVASGFLAECSDAGQDEGDVW